MSVPPGLPGALAPLLPLAALGLGAVAAMLAVPLRRPGTVRALAALSLACALALVPLMEAGGAPGGIAAALFRADGLAVFGTGLATLSGLGILAFLRPGHAAGEAPVLLLLAVLGAAVLVGARHGATLFLGLEITSLSLVALLAFSLDRSGLEAGYKYLLTSGAAASAFLLGAALLFAASGDLDLPAWAGAEGPAATLGLALVIGGLGARMALVPLHMWTPDAFAGASAGAAALSGIVAKAAIALALLRLAEAGLGAAPVWREALLLLGAASVLAGNALALVQTRLRRMLGYATVGHSGYLVLILALEHPLRAEATAFYLAAYALALAPALAVAARLDPAADLETLRGLLRHHPLGGVAFAVALLSLAGLPITAGFFAKVYLFTILAGSGAWVALAVAVAGSVLGAVYCLRFLTAASRSTAPPCRPERPEWPERPERQEALLLVAATALTAVLGVVPGLLTGALA